MSFRKPRRTVARDDDHKWLIVRSGRSPLTWSSLIAGYGELFPHGLPRTTPVRGNRGVISASGDQGETTARVLFPESVGVFRE